MMVECIGGPRDGQKMEVTDGLMSLRIPVIDGHLRFEEHPDPSEQVAFSVLDLPIVYSRSGRKYGLWREA